MDKNNDIYKKKKIGKYFLKKEDMDIYYLNISYWKHILNTKWKLLTKRKVYWLIIKKEIGKKHW